MENNKNQQLPKIAGKSSIKVNVESGKEYSWCSCGLSDNQPFCNGSHKGTGFKPLLFKATKDEIISFCACKQTNKSMICDGSHRKI